MWFPVPKRCHDLPKVYCVLSGFITYLNTDFDSAHRPYINTQVPHWALGMGIIMTKYYVGNLDMTPHTNRGHHLIHLSSLFKMISSNWSVLLPKIQLHLSNIQFLILNANFVRKNSLEWQYADGLLIIDCSKWKDQTLVVLAGACVLLWTRLCQMSDYVKKKKSVQGFLYTLKGKSVVQIKHFSSPK